MFMLKSRNVFFISFAEFECIGFYRYTCMTSLILDGVDVNVHTTFKVAWIYIHMCLNFLKSSKRWISENIFSLLLMLVIFDEYSLFWSFSKTACGVILRCRRTWYNYIVDFFLSFVLHQSYLTSKAIHIIWV